MPIIGINPDGTVKIARKSGADVRSVKPEELAMYNPALLEEYNKFSEEKQLLESKAGGQKFGTDAISEIVKQGGSSYLNKAKTKDERIGIAEEIMATGGLNEYRKIIPLAELVTTKEEEGLTASTDLLGQIDRSIPSMKEGPGGTGPIAGRRGISTILDIIGTPEGREARSTPEKVRASYQQMISGKVISDKEAERLKAFLPAKTKTETQNKEDLERLKDGIRLNLELFERGKREGLTANQAYDKYGAEILGRQLETKFGKSGVDTYLDKYFPK